MHFFKEINKNGILINYFSIRCANNRIKQWQYTIIKDQQQRDATIQPLTLTQPRHQSGLNHQ